MTTSPVTPIVVWKTDGFGLLFAELNGISIKFGRKSFPYEISSFTLYHAVDGFTQCFAGGSAKSEAEAKYIALSAASAVLRTQH